MASYDNFWNNYLSVFSLPVIFFFSFGFITCFQKKAVHIHLFFFLPYPSTLIQKYYEITEAIYYGWQKNQHCFLKHHKKRMLLSPPKSNSTKIFSPKISEKRRPLYIWRHGLSSSKLYLVYSDFKSSGSKVSTPSSTISERILVIEWQNILTRVRSKFWYVCLFKKEKKINRKGDIEVLIIK